MIHSSDYIQRLLTDAEADIARKLSMIFYRFSLNIQPNVGIYDLPTYTDEVIRVSWKGKKVWPLLRNELQALDKTFLTKTGEEPDYYTMFGDGIFKIRFYPIPTVTINATSDNLDSTEIRNRVIISCWRKPDRNSSSLTLPDYLARRLTKYYVLHRTFRREGHGQNIPASQYYLTRYNMTIDQLRTLKDKYFRATPKYIGPNKPLTGMIQRPQYAQLDKNFTITP